MSSVATRARNHYRTQQKVALAAVRATRRAVKRARTPAEAKVAAVTTVASYQLAAALSGARAMATEAGREILTAPIQYAGTTQLGYPIEYGIETIVDRIAEDMESELARLTETMMASLDLFVESEVIAAAADAASVEIAMEPAWTNYVRVLDLPSCDRCVILAGRIYRDLEAFPRHPKCFPAGTLVSGPGARSASRRWYEGELVVIRTAGGKELTATGNHPILTDQGWLPANLLTEGGYVVGRASGDRSRSLLVPDHDQMPARIEDVWSSGAVGSLRRMPVASQDFHGDGLGSSHVDVVAVNRALRDWQKVALFKEVCEKLLALRTELSVALNSTSAGAKLGRRHALSAPGFMGGLGLSGPVLRPHLASSNDPRFARPSDRYAGFDQASANDAARYAEPVGDRVLTFPTLVGLYKGENIEIAPPPNRTRWDAPSAEFSMETRSAYASLGLDLRSRLSSQVELDRIVELSRVEWSGHVYNLTSSEGWYDANGVIVSNCDCQHWPVESWAEAEAAGLVTDPMVAFERGQVRGLSKADEQAIRDGADIAAVVNAKRGGGRRPKGMTNAITKEIFGRTVKATLEGTTKRSEWRRKHPDLPIRLRPESIYEHATDREDAVRLLRLYGYIK